MRAVIQRVSSASLNTEGKLFSEIGSGLFILVGVKEGDSEADVEYLAQKIAKIRLMKDENDKINLSVKDAHAELLVVSQFTLYADVSGGNRPSFIKAASPDEARKLYELLVSRLKELGLKVKTGSFGNYMEIKPILDGPVTIVINSEGRAQ